MPEDEAAQSAVMAAWGTWFQNLGPALADGGNPVGQAKTIASDGSVSDGGGANPATGYSLIEADSLDAAVELAKGCPVLGGGATHRGCGDLQRHVVRSDRQCRSGRSAQDPRAHRCISVGRGRSRVMQATA